MDAPTPIKTCVLGVGLSGLTFHVPFILALPELFTLTSVLERNPKTPGGKVHDRFGATVKIHNTLDEVLADPDIELVIIGTPNETHYEFAKATLSSGKHVLVDKPVAATAAQAEELGALAKARKLVLYGYQNRRWDADFLTLKRLLSLPKSSPESLGDVFEFESRFDRYRIALKGTWKDLPLPASGMTYDLGSHLIDQALVLFGRPNSLTAFITNIRGAGSPEVDDSFSIFLHYARSSTRNYPLTCILRAHILSVRLQQVRYVVRGTKGTFTKVGVDPQEEQLKSIATPQEIFGPQFGNEPRDIWGVADMLRGDEVIKAEYPPTAKGSYADLFRDLSGAIRKGKMPEVKWEEATAVLEIIGLARRSAVEGRTVDVPQL